MRQICLLFVGFVFLLAAMTSNSYAGGPKIWIENAGGLFGGGDQVTNGKQKVGVGFFGRFDIEELVKDNPSALALAEESADYNTYAHISYWAGTLPAAFCFGFGIGMRDSTMTWVSAGALIGTSFLTGYFVSQSRHYMYESMNIYNGVENQQDARKTGHADLNSWQQVSAFKSLTNSNQMSFSFNF